jgi:hypothetical protein
MMGTHNAMLVHGATVSYGRVLSGERNAAGNIEIRFELQPENKNKKERTKYVSSIDPQHVIHSHFSGNGSSGDA